MRRYWAFACASFLAAPVIGFAATNPKIDSSDVIKMDGYRSINAPVEVTVEDFEASDSAGPVKHSEIDNGGAHMGDHGPTERIQIWLANTEVSYPPDANLPVEAIQGDWNGDGRTDFATLTDETNDYMATLTLYEGGPAGHLRKVAKISNYFAAKGEAGLTRRSDTAFSVHGVALAGWQSAVGRDLVIAYRDGAYVLAGARSWSHFGGNPARDQSCEWNFRTGKVISEKGRESVTRTIRQNEIWHATLSDVLDLDERMRQVCN